MARTDWDAVNRARLLSLRPEAQLPVAEMLRLAGLRGWEMAITCAVRTDAEQAALYAQGRTAPGAVVTHARDGSQTPHGERHRAAADIVFRLRGNGERTGRVVAPGSPLPGGLHSWSLSLPWADFGALARGCGLTWGGDFQRVVNGVRVPFKDLPHVELPGWRDLPPAR